LYVTLSVRLGPADPALEAFLRETPAGEKFDPRAGMVA
jgi:hypothetical protein